jgi:hypothetical protein
MYRWAAALAKAFHVWVHWQGHWVVLICARPARLPPGTLGPNLTRARAVRRWRSWCDDRYDQRERQDLARRREAALRQRLAGSPVMAQRCLRCLLAVVSAPRWRAFGGWRRGVALVQLERACRRCLAVWRPDGQHQLVLLGSWRRAARNVRLRRGRETKLAGLTRQAVHRIVSGATLRAWRRCVARRLEVRGLVAHSLLHLARRRSAAVLGEWRRAAATARKRLREFVRARAERRTRAWLEAWRVTAAALRAQAARNRQALEHCRGALLGRTFLGVRKAVALLQWQA